MMILASGGDLTGDTLDMNFVMTRGVKTRIVCLKEEIIIGMTSMNVQTL
jgi:hypothetical protein